MLWDAMLPKATPTAPLTEGRLPQLLLIPCRWRRTWDKSQFLTVTARGVTNFPGIINKLGNVLCMPLRRGQSSGFSGGTTILVTLAYLICLFL